MNHAPSVYIPTFTSFSKDNCDRLGFAISEVVWAWSCFAAHLGYTNVQHMVKPYIYMNMQTLKYTALETRESGYAPPSQSTRFNTNDVPQSSTSGSVETLSDECDTNLRILAKEFLTDLETVCTHNSLYSLRADQMRNWIEFSEIRMDTVSGSDSGELPARFQKFSELLWKPIQDMRHAAGFHVGIHAKPDIELTKTLKLPVMRTFFDQVCPTPTSSRVYEPRELR
ncbi:hypothetical protein FGB62_69g259 [Gracilaria domingensis]|nr:hypothetical protein FGB62_69g259 [Gracilaria domingensis]